MALNKKYEAKLKKDSAKITSFNHTGVQPKNGMRVPGNDGKRKNEKPTAEVQLANADWDVPAGTVMAGQDAVELVDTDRAKAIMANDPQQGKQAIILLNVTEAELSDLSLIHI